MKGKIVLLMVAVLTLMIGSDVLADTFPSKPINLWIGWGAGSAADVSNRASANVASKNLKQPVIVSNITGGGGTLVLGRLKEEKPDGYTIAQSSSAALSRTPHLQPVPFNAQNPLGDFVPVYSYYNSVHGLAVRSDSPWKTLEEFIAYAKANPGKVRYSTSGAGTGQHLSMEYLGLKENIKWTHVPFPSSPQAVAAVVGGHVEAVAQTPEWKEFVDSGKLRLLACLNEKRLSAYPNIPTLREKGYDFDLLTITVIYAPAKTPKDVVTLLNKAFRQASETEEMKQILNNYGLTLEIHDSEELIQIIKKDYEANGKLIKELGLGIYKKN